MPSLTSFFGRIKNTRPNLEGLSIPSNKIQVNTVCRDYSELEDKTYRELLASKFPFSGRKQPAEIKYYDRLWFIEELTPVLIERLKDEGTKSVAHMIDYFNDPRIGDPNVSFQAPKSIDDLQSDDIKINFVADFGYEIQPNYMVFIGGKFEWIGVVNPIIGPRDVYGVVAHNFGNTILCSTSAPNLELLQVPPIELLHRFIHPYTVGHPKLNIKREEKFVHAAGDLWFRQYNSDRGLGFSDSELEVTMKKYEQFPLYHGKGELRKMIELLGFNKSLDLYINDPNRLFSLLDARSGRKHTTF